MSTTITELYTGTGTSWGTEWSLTNGSTSIATQTADCRPQLVLDLNALAANDQLRVKLLEKAISGGTQRVIAQWPISYSTNKGWVQPEEINVIHGWDYTITSEAGNASVSIPYSIRTAADASAASSTFTLPDQLAFRIESGDITQYLYFQALANATGLPVTGLSSGWTVSRNRGTGDGSGVAWTTPTIAEVDATKAPGVYSLLLDEDTTITDGALEEILLVNIQHASHDTVNKYVILTRLPDVAFRGTLAAADTSQATLSASDTSTVTDQFKGHYLVVIKGTAVGQSNGPITASNFTTRVVSFTKPWNVTPDSTSVYRRYTVAPATTTDDVVTAIDEGAPNVTTAAFANTSAEPTSIPASTATTAAKIDWMFHEMIKGKTTQTSSQKKVYDSTGLVLLATLSTTDDGTTATKNVGA